MQKRNLSDKILNTQTTSCVNALDFIIKETLINNRPADKTVSYYFKQNKQLGSRDRRFILEVCYSVLRWWKWIENVIPEKPKELLKPNESGQPIVFSDELLLHFFTYLKMITFAALIEKQDLIPEDLIKFWTQKLKLTKFKLDQISHIDDIVKKAQKIISAITEESSPKLSYMSLLPEWISKELPKNANLKDISQIMQKRPPMWLRCQTDKIDELIRELKKVDATAKRHKKLKTSIYVENPKINLYSLDEFQKGLFEVQDAASQMIGIVCNAQPGEWWWDACAGAGGKTLQLAHMMQNKGRIVASDIRAYKLEDLKKRAKRSNLSNINCSEWDGKKLSPRKSGKFDGVLVDAPCTCSGTWRRNPDAKLKIRRDEIQEMAELQLKILSYASDAVKPGGVLIYATCSMFEKENAGVVKKFLSVNSNFTIEPFVNPLSGNMTDGTLDILPWHLNCDAMFVARFRKKDK